MPDLSTTYMGLTLRNPVIVGSSGLTRSAENARKADAAGAGAIVLKSIFEEQIERQVAGLLSASAPALWHPEAAEYINLYGRENAVVEYLDLIGQAKDSVSVPVIGSIHCVSAGAWTEFARRVEEAGADALELNVFVLPSDPRRSGVENEKVYFDIANAVTSKVSIPVALKIGPYFSGLTHMIKKLSQTRISALVLFNRFYRLDFDIEHFKIVPASHLSSPGETELPLRWISILSGEVDCDLAATTGVHDGDTVVKHVLAGAKAVQVCSALYKNGLDHIGTMLGQVTDWMNRHRYDSIEAFRGRMSQAQSGNPAAYERVQFMRASVGIE
jgi:dihydroorotate dehydrogenase (fumarate)